ncbi:MAG TPA: hypothetical protein VGM51_04390 [Armatimonadota bacterium]|jgi:hypothetical protein
MRIQYNVKSALGELGNLLFLGFGAALYLASGAVPILLGALVIECAYLMIVPPSAWYRGILEERAFRLRQRDRARLKTMTLPRLLPADRKRFLRLETMRNQIPAAAGTRPAEMAGICGQMDVLLDKFLQFGAKNAQYRAYLVEMVRPAPGPAQSGAPWLDKLFDLAGTLLNEKQDYVQIPVGGTPKRVTDVGAIIDEIRKDQDARIQQLQASIGAQTSDANKMVMSKNLEVLTKRRTRIGELGDIITNLECQLDLIESTFGLIADQVRTQAPEQVLREINEVVIQTETTTQLLAATAPMEAALSHLENKLS